VTDRIIKFLISLVFGMRMKNYKRSRKIKGS